jgi:hypothetical protein
MAAGPELTSTYGDLLIEMKGPLVENYPKYSVALSQLAQRPDAKFTPVNGVSVGPAPKSRNTREDFSGSQVRVPIIRNVKQGTGAPGESGTLNVARNVRTTKVTINLATVTHAVQISRRLKAVSGNSVTSWGQAMKLEMQLAEEAMPRVMNEYLNGDGTGLLATISDSTASATHTVTGALAYQLYAGRVVDCLKISDGTVRSAGNEISSYSETTASTGTVVFGTSWDSSTDGASADGIYVEGSYGTTNVPQGIQQAASFGTATFEGLAKTNADWKGVDGRNGDTTPADLSIAIMDGAIRRRGRNGLDGGGFWIGSVGAIQKFGQTLLTQARWDGSKQQLQTGWKGIEYEGDILIGEYDHPASQITWIPQDDITFYATQAGPDWDDEDGSVFKRFSRALPVEAWLVDEVQFGVHRCNRFVSVKNLNEAA